MTYLHAVRSESGHKLFQDWIYYLLKIIRTVMKTFVKNIKQVGHSLRSYVRGKKNTNKKNPSLLMVKTRRLFCQNKNHCNCPRH